MVGRRAINLAVATVLIGTASMPALIQKGIEPATTSEIAARTDKEKGIVVTTTNRRFTFTNVYPDNTVSEEQFRTLWRSSRANAS